MNINSVLEFLKIFSQFTDFNADEVCSSEKLFIPTSKDEFITVMKSQRISDQIIQERTKLFSGVILLKAGGVIKMKIS